MAPWLYSLTGIALTSIAIQNASRLDDKQIFQVQRNMLEVSKASWELGAAAEALLELLWPSYSVFDASAFPPVVASPENLPHDVLSIAERIVSSKPADSLALLPNEGSAADPASLGTAVLLANWTRNDQSNNAYANAARGQLHFLLDFVGRSQEGAISHRVSEVQLWADFVYMVPPFIAYYGALEGGPLGDANIQTAYDQCRLYRNSLRDDQGLWRHVALGSWSDGTHWATGNAWAAAGMLRVLYTMHHAASASRFSEQQTDLAQWINEILEASWSHQTADGSLRNVIDNPASFNDMSATALMASVTLRMAVLQNDNSKVAPAIRALNVVHQNIDADGWLQNVVDPIKFHSPLPPGEHSPEGQAFVVMLQSAWVAFEKFVTNNSL